MTRVSQHGHYMSPPLPVAAADMPCALCTFRVPTSGVGECCRGGSEKRFAIGGWASARCAKATSSVYPPPSPLSFFWTESRRFSRRVISQKVVVYFVLTVRAYVLC
jgi:hypothetical protein